MSLYDYTGVIHLHSSFSHDGHEPMEEIIQAAARNGIDFLMLTDHDHLRARNEGWEGWQNKTLVVVGEEIAPRFNHYLAFNIREPVVYLEDTEGEDPQKYIDAVNHQGGFGFIAHPDHEGTALFHVKQYSWKKWNIHGYAGISIWDFMTDWQSSLRSYALGLLSFLFPVHFLTGPRKITLERWDALNQVGKTVGIGELDNHASVKKLLGIRFIAFPFDRAFRFIRTHILTDDPFSGDSQKDIDMVYQSLRYGRCYFALEYFRRTIGFQFQMTQGIQEFYMGDSLKLGEKTLLSVSVPSSALIRIIRNGSILQQKTADRLSLPVSQTGVYRVEVYLKATGMFRPWIFSNPIFVT